MSKTIAIITMDPEKPLILSVDKKGREQRLVITYQDDKPLSLSPREGITISSNGKINWNSFNETRKVYDEYLGAPVERRMRNEQPFVLTFKLSQDIQKLHGIILHQACFQFNPDPSEEIFISLINVGDQRLLIPSGTEIAYGYITTAERLR